MKTKTKTSETLKGEFCCALFCWFFPSFLIISTKNILFEPWSLFTSICLILALGFFISNCTWIYFTLEVPAQTAQNLKHFFSGKLITYGSGFFFIYPWYLKRNGKGIFSLEVKKENLKEDYPAKDGPKLIAKLMFKYQPDINNLVQFELMSEDVIKEGLLEQASSFLLRYIKETNAEDARKNIKKLQTQVEIEFEIKEGKKSRKSNIEESYGIIMKEASLIDLDYELSYQQALTNHQIARKIQEMADEIYIHHGGKIHNDGTCTDGAIPRREAFDKAMILFDKATQATIKGNKNAMIDMNSN